MYTAQPKGRVHSTAGCFKWFGSFWPYYADIQVFHWPLHVFRHMSSITCQLALGDQWPRKLTQKVNISSDLSSVKKYPDHLMHSIIRQTICIINIMSVMFNWLFAIRCSCHWLSKLRRSKTFSKLLTHAH